MKRMLLIVVLASIVGLLAHFGVFFVLRFKDPVDSPSPPARINIQYTGRMATGPNPVLKERGILQDSAPLFMPTRWNLASEMGRVASLREATEVFTEFRPRLSLPDRLPDSGVFPPSDAVLMDDWIPEDPAFVLAAMGREFDEPRKLLGKALILRAQRLDEPGQSSPFTMVLPESLAESVPESLWSPPRLHLHLVEGKALGLPVLAKSSGFTDWDKLIQKFVASLPLYRSLQNGYYDITVFP